MSRAWQLTVCVVGVVVLTCILVGWLLGRLRSSSRVAPRTPGQALLAHSRDRSDYRLYVGLPPGQPTTWAKVAHIDAASLTLHDARVIGLPEVTAYFVAYPSGRLVDSSYAGSLPLPAWVGGLERADGQDRHELAEADLKEGLSLVQVTFGPSTSRPGASGHYSTTLTNISGQRVRVLRFGGYQPIGRSFRLSTVTGRYFTAADFKDWYGQKGDWIEPGQAVTDPNNYGGPPSLWAYLFELEGGREFLTGGIVK